MATPRHHLPSTLVLLFGQLAVSCTGSSELETTSAGASTEAGAENDDGQVDDAEAKQAVEIASAWFEARDRRDLDTTLALLSPDAEILDFGFWPRAPAEYEGLFAWMEILQWSWHLEACEVTAGPDITVSCTHLMENEWSRAQGVDPVPGTITLGVEDGAITRLNSDIGVWLERVFRPWESWVHRQYPEDVETMFRFDENGRFSGGPATDPEALALYRLRVSEYVDELTGDDDDG